MERRRLGEIIRERRSITQMSQTHLATLSGVPQPRISDYEHGKLQLNDEDRELLEHAFGLSRGQMLIEAGLVDMSFVTEALAYLRLIVAHMDSAPWWRADEADMLENLDRVITLLEKHENPAPPS